MLKMFDVLPRPHLVVAESHMFEILIILAIEGASNYFARAPAKTHNHCPISLLEVVFVDQLSDTRLVRPGGDVRCHVRSIGEVERRECWVVRGEPCCSDDEGDKASDS